MIAEKLEAMERRFDAIETDMANPNATSNMEEYKKLAREYAELRDVVGLFREWKGVRDELGRCGRCCATRRTRK